MRQTGTVVGAICLLLSFLFSKTSAAELQTWNGRVQDALVCDEAIDFAAQEFDIPKTVLKALARTESGTTVNGSFVAWPWTINIEGQGQRFSSKSEALDYFESSYGRGARNIDLGCFQVNHRWHGDRFASVDDMLNPRLNARYAAKFLKELHFEFGSWVDAVGAFHSRTREFSEKYLARYLPILRTLTGAEPRKGGTGRTAQKANQFPLLKGSSKSGARGSLFPLSVGSGRSLLTTSGVSG